MFLSVDSSLMPYVPAAVARLSYLHPETIFEGKPSGVFVAGTVAMEADALRREISYAIYREKIYADTLAMRSALLKAVTR